MSSRPRKISAGDVSSKWISFLDKEGVHIGEKNTETSEVRWASICSVGRWNDAAQPKNQDAQAH